VPLLVPSVRLTPMSAGGFAAAERTAQRAAPPHAIWPTSSRLGASARCIFAPCHRHGLRHTYHGAPRVLRGSSPSKARAPTHRRGPRRRRALVDLGSARRTRQAWVADSHRAGRSSARTLAPAAHKNVKSSALSFGVVPAHPATTAGAGETHMVTSCAHLRGSRVFLLVVQLRGAAHPPPWRLAGGTLLR